MVEFQVLKEVVACLSEHGVIIKRHFTPKIALGVLAS